jgi:hypothetical protein
MATKAKGKYRLIPVPKTYTDLSNEQSVQLLTKDLKRIISALNEDRLVQEIPQPTGVIVGGGSGYAVIQWDDVDDTYRTDLDGARIWRANYADDNHSVFDQNGARGIIVDCVRTTKWLDVEVSSGTYIYWVQWINKEGIISDPSGGGSGTVT